MKKITLALFTLFLSFNLSAQIVISGGCVGPAVTLNEGGGFNGRPDYLASNVTIDGVTGTLEIFWDNVLNEWQLLHDGQFILVNENDTAEPPSTGWINDASFLCPGAGDEPTVDASALPVTWAYIKGERFEKTNVMVMWGTFEESANAGFHVERSTDGLNWQHLEFVPSNEAQSSLNEYEYLDQTPLIGENFYRLQQEDFGGITSYSEVVQVTLNPEAGAGGLVMPNPANNEITLVGPEVSGDLIILSQHGQVVRRINNYTPGESIFVGDLPTNSYILRFGNGKQQITKKITIL